jgi:nitrite reductase/ring-hydroxylating ferredoxin subunit
MHYMKHLSIKISYVYCIIALIFISCKGDVSTIPYTRVNFTAPIYSTNLIHVGGYEYFTGGISGIIVYRVDMTNFCAYDRACPYDWSDDGYVIYDPATLQLECQVCGSTFNVLNGYPMENTKAKTPLRSYQARLINDMTLHVYN